VERDELEVAAVLESDERIVGEAAGMLAARCHGETTLPMFGDRGVEIEDDEHDVIEAADHVPVG
jgi:hypothetical protein